jgi:hypothetical protein
VKEKLQAIQKLIISERKNLEEINQTLDELKEEFPRIFDALELQKTTTSLIRKHETEARNLAVEVLQAHGSDALPSLFYPNPRKEWKYHTGKVLGWVIQSGLYGLLKIDDKKLGNALKGLPAEKLTELEAEQVETPYVSVYSAEKHASIENKENAK